MESSSERTSMSQASGTDSLVTRHDDRVAALAEESMLNMQEDMSHKILSSFLNNLDDRQLEPARDRMRHPVNLGVLSCNPSSNSGVIEIMTFLHQFVPVRDNKLLPILCCGDGLSVERMTNCHCARNTGETPSDRVEGLIPTPQEFHREMILLQDTMDLLYIHESDFARGTIAHLKNDFDHRSFKKQVSANVQHSWDMMEFATTAYITLLATTTCQMSTVDDVPADFPEAKEDQLTWLRSLANVIVDFAWMPPEQEQIDLVAACAGSPGESFEEDIVLYCICKDDKQESMVQCSSSSCSAGSISLVQAFPKPQRETGSVASSVRRTVAIFIAGARKHKREKWFSASWLTPVPSMSGTTWHASCHLTDLMHRTSGTAAKAAKWWTQVGRERILSLTTQRP